jgi:hypothetical protein
MTEVIVAIAQPISQGLCALGRGLRRSVVAVCAAAAMIVIYGLGSIGTYGLSVAGISTLSLATSATPANAYRRRRGRGFNVWFGRRRRRRGWYPYRYRRRRRRHRGIYFRF